MFWFHRAIIREPLIDRNRCTAGVHTSVYLHAIIQGTHARPRNTTHKETLRERHNAEIT
jgi:hypothetical protein